MISWLPPRFSYCACNSWEILLYGFNSSLNPSHLKISMHILYPVLYQYIPLKVLTSRISLTIQSFFSWWSIIFIILMSLTLYRLTSVFIFSTLFSAHLLMCWQREFVQQSKVSLVGDYFLYSHDINVWFSGDNVGRN